MASTAANPLDQLEFLSMTNSLVQELQNHIGDEMGDKTLAEFIVAMHEESKDASEFKGKLKEVGGEQFSDSLMVNLDRLINAMHPKYKGKRAASGTAGGVSGTAAAAAAKSAKEKANVLSLPDGNRWKSIDDLIEEERREKEKNPVAKGVDDLMSQLDSIGEKRKSVAEDAAGSSRGNGWGDRGDRSRDNGRDDYDRGRSSRRVDVSPPRLGRNGRDVGGGSGGGARPRPDDKPVQYKIYDGKVTNMRDFGAFVQLEGLMGRHEGMVHIGSIQQGARLNHPSDAVAKGESVKVKVMSITGNRISLSMKDVDQTTGRDLSPHLRVMSEQEIAEQQLANATGGNNAPLGKRGMGGFDAPEPPKKMRSFADDGKRSAKRLTSPERWEIKQLIASGAVSAADYPDLHDHNANADFTNPNNTQEDEELDIEVREDDAPFLAGQSRKLLDLSPVKIIKAPDGTLNRAALQGATLAKERRELRQQEAQDAADAEAQDLSSAWQDPLAKRTDRQFAQDARGSAMGRMAEEQPAWKKETFGKANIRMGKQTSLPMKEQREGLPVFKFRQQLIDAVHDNQILVVVGDTGSGKTTQMTQYLAEEGFADRLKIGCTQPRRVAAMSVAKRVAEEVGCRLGAEVGYTIRFEDCSSPETKIKYMTDGMLQREALIDPDMSAYSVIMLDEAHERTIATDVLFALLKKACKRRPDLKIIVTSATLDAEKFSTYFFNAPIFTIPGRMHPVEILYTKEPESDYLDAALITVMQIHLAEPEGDILVFLTGAEEIDTSAEILYERMKALGPQVPELIVLPVYSSLPSEMQSRIFEPTPPGARKCILATNIAETSLTIDGIYYVVDPGFSKQNAYDPRTGMDQLILTPISQAQARQRSGRAGRTGPGKCYRLFTEAAFQNEMLPNPVPEIQRQNLASTILTLKAMGINDLINFDFMDAPPQQTMVTALENLYALSALDDEGLLTRLGRKMADFPMDPAMAKMLIASCDLGCSEEILTIVCMLSAENIFYRPKDKQAQADAKKAKFHQPEGDHLTLLTVYNGWKASKFSKPWTVDNFIHGRSLAHAQDVRKQLLGIMDRYKNDIISCGNNYNRIRRAICSGYFRHAAKKDPQEGYKTLVEGTPVFLHPSSALFNRAPEWIVYHDLLMTTREYCRNVTVIEPRWLTEVAPQFFKVADAARISKRKREERIQPLFDRFAKDQDEWRLSKFKKMSRTSQTFG